MPSSHQQSVQILGRLCRDSGLADLEAALRPLSPAEKSLPPSVPSRPGAVKERLALLKDLGHALPYVSGSLPLDKDPSLILGHIENHIGFAQVPIGIAGPLRINGAHARGDHYLPLATHEGALVASYHRGCRLISHAGGATCLTLGEQVQRAPAFLFKGVAEAARFAAHAASHFGALRKAAGRSTRHGRLLDAAPHLEGHTVHIILEFHTQDAAGQNMATFAAEEVCRDLLRSSPVRPRVWFLEGNMSGDKKATFQSLLKTRGRKCIAEVRIPGKLLHRALRADAPRMQEYWHTSFVGGAQTGSIGVGGHMANALAALFIACGQDAACVSEAGVGVTRMEAEGDGSLYASVTLPGLVVGTVGGGTCLPTARECLALLGCLGEGRAPAFAEVCAAAVLAGELSLIGALCAHEFGAAHRRLGRPSTKEHRHAG